MSFPTDPLDRLIVFLGNREGVQRRTGFIAMADDYAAQLAAVQALRSDLTAAQAEIAELRARCERVFSQWRAQSIRCGDDIIASNVLYECAHDLERELTKSAKANPGGAHE